MSEAGSYLPNLGVVDEKLNRLSKSGDFTRKIREDICGRVIFAKLRAGHGAEEHEMIEGVVNEVHDFRAEGRDFA